MAATIDQDRWRRAYESEIARLAALTPERVLSTVFFGGGTPSLIDPDVLDAVLTAIRSHWSLSNRAEITLEANPTSVEAGRFRAYAAAGVNRLSLGVQALNDTDLRRLGRRHTAAEALAAFEVARAAFPRVSFDLIYARQNQTLEAWKAELSRALDLAIDHLSLYQLTIENGTAFGDRLGRGGLRGLPNEDLSADLFDLTQEMTAAVGMPAYEVSNHARADAEARHNLIYWRGGDYAGIGPGAHGRLTLGNRRLATEAPIAPQAWLKAVEDGVAHQFPRSEISQDQQVSEYLMMGLRLREGVSQNLLDDLRTNPEIILNINALVEESVLLPTDAGFTVAPGARPVLNTVLRRLLT